MSELDVKELLKEKIDIAELADYMVKNHLFHPKAVTNEYAFDSQGNVNFFVDLRKDTAVKIICPRHRTKRDNSTSLHRERNSFKCWAGGCELEGITLNLFDFYMVFRFNVPVKMLGDKQVGEQFKQTVKELAEYAGIPYHPVSSGLSEEAMRRVKRQEIRKQAAAFYHEQYKSHPHALKAKTYMEETRGFQYGSVSFQDLVSTYQLGYAHGEFGTQELYNVLKKNGHSDTEIVDAGVCFRYQYKKKQYDDRGQVIGYQPVGEPRIIDRLTNGMVMPYFERGQVTNLYSRSLQAKSKDFRHMRLAGSVEEPINFDVAQHFKDVIVVEGEFSWLSLIALGFENTIGNRGTNGLSSEHVALFKKVRDSTNWSQCATIYLCFDPDDPGQTAIEVTGERLVEEGFDVRVVRLKDGDPNDFLQLYKEAAKEKFQELLDTAVSYEAFRVLREVEKQQVRTAADKLAFFKKIRSFKDKMVKDERMMVAYEVAAALQIDSVILLTAWDVIAPQPPQEIPGFKEAVKQTWVFAVDNPHLYELLVKSGLPNAVCLDGISPLYVTSELKKIPGVTKLVFNSGMEREMKQELMEQLPTYQFLTFLETDMLQTKERITREDIMSHLRNVQ